MHIIIGDDLVIYRERNHMQFRLVSLISNQSCDMV